MMLIIHQPRWRLRFSVIDSHHFCYHTIATDGGDDDDDATALLHTNRETMLSYDPTFGCIRFYDAYSHDMLFSATLAGWFFFSLLFPSPWMPSNVKESVCHSDTFPLSLSFFLSLHRLFFHWFFVYIFFAHTDILHLCHKFIQFSMEHFWVIRLDTSKLTPKNWKIFNVRYSFVMFFPLARCLSIELASISLLVLEGML